jgi:hypothetical protein
VAADGVVFIDPAGHGMSGLLAGGEQAMLGQQLDLQSGVERLGDGVVERRAGAPLVPSTGKRILLSG